MTLRAATLEEVVIEPGRRSSRYWRDLWAYRELFYFLAWRDVLVRYKQTIAGIAWAWLRPVAAVIVSTVVFGRIANLPAEGAPYALMVMVGMLPWQLFANALSDSGSSLLSNANLISKVYFPRMIVPASTVVVALVDFLIAAAIAALMMAWYGVMPTWRIVALPWFIALAVMAALGAGLWLSALTVAYRDFRFIAPFLVQFGFFITPVAYTSTVVPDAWATLYSLNPLVGIVDGFRWALLPGAPPLRLVAQSVSIVSILAVLATGAVYFRRTERTFADVI